MTSAGIWDELAPSLVVGVNRRPVEPGLLTRVLGTTSPDRGSHADLWTTLHLCGQATRVRGGVLDGVAAVRPEPLVSAPETRPEAGEEWAGLARQVISNGRAGLLRVAVEELAERSMLLPRETVIPVTRCLLDGFRDGTDEAVEARAALRETVGNLGRAVVALHPEWAGELLAPDTPDTPDAQDASDIGGRDAVWRDGTVRERAALLEAQRTTDPDWARERLRESTGVRAAGERRELLAVWTHRAQPADTGVVGLFLKDRSSKVTQLAERILAGIPGTDVARRRERDAAARLDELGPAELAEVLGVLDPARVPEVFAMSVDDLVARRPDSLEPLTRATAEWGRYDLLLHLLRGHAVHPGELPVGEAPPELREELFDAAEPRERLSFLPQWRQWTPRLVDALLDLVADVVGDDRARPPLAGAVRDVVKELPLRAPLPAAGWDPTPRLRDLSRADEAGRGLPDLLLRAAADYSLRHQFSTSLTRTRS